jgi:uncharacterized protein YqhQ
VSEQDKNKQEKLSAAYDESGLICRTHVGGQALIEGIMMRGRYNWALAVRKPNGSIYVEEHDLASGKDKNSWMYKPVVRGCTALAESLALGYKALEIAANQAFDEEEAQEDEEKILRCAQDDSDNAQDDSESAQDDSDNAQDDSDSAQDDSESAQDDSESAQDDSESAQDDSESAQDDSSSILPKSLMTGAMILGVLMGIVIFIVVPAIVTNLIVGDYAQDTLLWNIVDGVLRVAIFVGYVFLIGRMPDIKRMFGYHGAEHRTIHCYERGKELTVANAQSFPSLHVRCGTAFMLMTMIIAILVFTLVPIQLLINGLGIQNDILRLIVVIMSRIILLPLIAGLSYEFTVKWAGAHPDNPLVKVVLWPGLQLQRLTTNPPDDEMVECAIAAMNAVLAREQKEAQKSVLPEGQVEAQGALS